MNYDTSKSMHPDELAELVKPLPLEDSMTTRFKCPYRTLRDWPDCFEDCDYAETVECPKYEQGTSDGADDSGSLAHLYIGDEESDYLQTDYMPEQPDSVSSSNASQRYVMIPAGQRKVRASQNKATTNAVPQEINTTIFMEPTGKARARTTTTKTGRVMAYTPAKTVQAENLIRNHLTDMLVKFERDVPLRIEVIFWFRRPEHCPKKRVFPTVRPDWDNCAKLVCDAANRYIWEDDAQVVTAIIKKLYCLPGHLPRIDVRVSEEHA